VLNELARTHGGVQRLTAAYEQRLAQLDLVTVPSVDGMAWARTSNRFYVAGEANAADAGAARTARSTARPLRLRANALGTNASVNFNPPPVEGLLVAADAPRPEQAAASRSSLSQQILGHIQPRDPSASRTAVSCDPAGLPSHGPADTAETMVFPHLFPYNEGGRTAPAKGVATRLRRARRASDDTADDASSVAEDETVEDDEAEEVKVGTNGLQAVQPVRDAAGRMHFPLACTSQHYREMRLRSINRKFADDALYPFFLYNIKVKEMMHV
jgi:hypothetical protein